jgi:hypothetical protein
MFGARRDEKRTMRLMSGSRRESPTQRRTILTLTSGQQRIPCAVIKEVIANSEEGHLDLDLWSA